MSNIILDSPNGVGRFLPTNISNCILWLDAADVGTLNLTGSTVNTWTDKASSIPFGSKNGTGITYSNSLVNLASASFLKNNSGSITIGQTFTIFLVASNTTGTQAAAIYLSSLASGSPGIYVEWTTTTNYRFTYRFPAGQGGGTTLLVPVSSGVIPLTIGTLYRSVSGANYQLGMGINGSLTPSTTPDTSSGPLGSCSVLAFGTNYQNDSQPDRPLTGAIAEIIVYNGELSPAQREQVEGYLAWKWGRQQNIPELHPYDNLPTYTLTTTNEFNPTYLGNCQFWYDANDLATITLSGSNVTNWNDKSGNGRNLSRYTTPGPFLTSNFNGSYRTVQAIANSNGTIQILAVPSGAMQGSTGSSFFAVLNYDSGGVIALYNEPRFLCLQGPARYDYGPLGSNVVYNLPSGFSYSNAQIFCQTLDIATNTLRVFQTGSELSNVVVTPITLTYSKSFGFWGIPESGLVPGYGKLSEFIGYNRFLSTAERQQVEGYLAWKWGLQGSLPSTHPYKNQPVFFFSPTFPQTSIPIGLRPITFNNPQDIATLEYWFDASDRSTISSSGTTLTAWANKGTAGSNGNISVVTGTPTTGVASQNRLNCIGLTSGTSISFTGQFSNQPRTRFFASRPTVNTTTTAVIFLYQGGTSFNGYDYISLENTSGALEIAQGQIVNMQTNAVPQHQNTFFIYTFLNGSTAARNRIAFTGAPQALITNIAANQYFGGSVTTYINNNSSSSSTSGQEIGEILSYNSELPLHETQIVEGYLAWKWGAQGSLPLDHPFKLFPPPPYVIPPIPPPPPPPPFSGWSIVLDGADASVNNNGGGSYTCNGPNDGGGSGWAYIYGLFSTAGSFTYNFNWSTSDGITWDWPFEFVTSSNPANPANVNFNTKIASANTQSGSRSVSYGANQYVVLGVYSADSVAGNGVCTFSGLPT